MGRRAGAGCRQSNKRANRPEMGARLRNQRAVSYRIGVGRARNRTPHRGPLPHRRLPGVAIGQGNRHQPGADAGHRGHDYLGVELCRAQLPADRCHLLPVCVSWPRALARLHPERHLSGADARLRRKNRQPHRRHNLLRHSPQHHVEPALYALCRDERVEDAGARRRRTPRRLRLPRFIWRCKTAPWTHRKTH